MTQEQAMLLLQKLNSQGYLDNVSSSLADNDSTPGPGGYANLVSDGIFGEGKIHPSVLNTRNDAQFFESYPSNTYQGRPEIHRSQSNFAPFSPDPNAFPSEMKHRESFSRSEMLPHPSKAYAPGFFPLTQDLKDSTSASATSKTSPTSTRPTSAPRYNTYLESSNTFGGGRVSGRPEVTISRPSSGQTATRRDADTQEFDAMQDLNGTLASLELDRPWRSTPENSSSSGGSVQFRMTTERTPSPRN